MRYYPSITFYNDYIKKVNDKVLVVAQPLNRMGM